MWTLEEEQQIDSDYQQRFDDYMERGRTSADGMSKNVQQAYDVYWNKIAPVRTERYRNHVMKQKQERVKSALDVELVQAYENGDQARAMAMLTVARDADLIEKPAYENAVNNWSIDSVLAGAHRSSQMGDYNGTIEALESLDKSKVPTDRLEAYNKITKYANSALTTQTDTAITDSVINMYANRNLPPEERMLMEDQIVEGLVAAGVQGTDLAREMERVAKWVNGDPDKPSNAVVKADRDMEALRVAAGDGSLDEFNKKTSKDRKSGAINDKDYIDVRETANRKLESRWASTISDAMDYGRRQIVDKEESAMEIWMQQALSTGVDDADIESEIDKQKMQYQAVSMLKRDLLDWIDQNGQDKTVGDFEAYRDEQVQYYDDMKVEHIRNEKTKRAEERLVRAAMPDDEKGELTESDLEIEASIIAANMSMQKFIDPNEAGYNDPTSFDTGINRWKENTKYYLPMMTGDEKKALDIFLGPDGHPDQVVGALLMLAAKYGMPSNQVEQADALPAMTDKVKKGKEKTIAEKEKEMQRQEEKAIRNWGALK